MSRNPYLPPESKVDGAGEPGEPETRPPLGGCLVTLLVVMIIGNAVTTVTYSLAALGQFELPGLAPWIVPTFLVAALANIVSLAAVFHWQRWGVYVALICPLIIFGLNAYLGASRIFSFFGLLGPAVLLLLVRPLWKHFK
jgi:hypothetical protein